jgi:predicted transcriptional regulator
VNRLKFNLNSDQLELLLAFENAKGLGHLAELMARDPSVISRNLQRVAEDYPVLKKVKGRWEITPL